MKWKPKNKTKQNKTEAPSEVVKEEGNWKLEAQAAGMENLGHSVGEEWKL